MTTTPPLPGDQPPAQTGAQGDATTALPHVEEPTTALPQVEQTLDATAPLGSPAVAPGTQEPGGTGTTTPAASPLAPDPVDAVWSAPAPAPSSLPAGPSRGVRTGTTVWGTILLALGVLLIAVGLGARIDLATTGILLLGGLGALLLVLAVLPRRAGQGHTEAHDHA